jgi:tetratricopeptide (TPR) repeat protein
MEFKTLLSLIATVVIVSAPAAYAHAPDSTLVAAVHDGDAAFAAFDNKTARACYERAFAIDSTNCEVLWKLAHMDVNCGMAAPKDDRPRWFATAERLARRAVVACPDSADAHFFLAVAIGQMTRVVGNKQRIELSKELKAEAEKALALNPRQAGAMHVLGRWNYEMAGLGWFSRAVAKIVYGGVPSGSYEEAKKWFDRAIAVRPAMPLNHLWLGETLVKLHDYARARTELQTCLALKDALWDDHITKAQARARLQEIEGKN